MENGNTRASISSGWRLSHANRRSRQLRNTLWVWSQISAVGQINPGNNDSELNVLPASKRRAVPSLLCVPISWPAMYSTTTNRTAALGRKGARVAERCQIAKTARLVRREGRATLCYRAGVDFRSPTALTCQLTDPRLPCKSFMTTAVSQDNHSLVGNGLNLLAAGLGPYVVDKMTNAVAAGRYQPTDASAVGEIAGDVAVMLRLMAAAWNDVFRDCLGPVERSLVSEIREIRNRWAHLETFDDDDLDRALDSIGRLLAAVGAVKEADRVNRAKHRLRIRRYGVPSAPPAAPAPAEPEPEPVPAPRPQPPVAALPANVPTPGNDERQSRPQVAPPDGSSQITAEADDHIRRGVAYRREEKFEQAMAEFELAVGINQDNPDAWYHRGLAWGLMGEHRSAIADFSRAIALAPEYADAYNCRGYALLCLSEYRLALRDLEQASRLNPDDELTQRNLRQARLHCPQPWENDAPAGASPSPGAGPS